MIRIRISKIKNSRLFKTHIAYLLIILNLVVWNQLYERGKHFYDAIKGIRIESVSAKEMPHMQSGNNLPELSMEEWVTQEIKKAGLSSQEAWAIIQCESRWDPYAINVNTNKTTDLGLWQINAIHKLSRECQFDYKCATKWAIDKRLNDGNWSAWVCAKKLGIN